MKEVHPGIHAITEYSRVPALKPPANLYVFMGRDGLIFDAGYGNRKYIRQVERELASLSAEKGGEAIPSRILISHSHPDHFSGLHRLQRRLSLTVLLTGRMAAYVRSSRSYRHSYLVLPRAEEGIAALLRRWCILAGSVVTHIPYRLLYGMRFVSEPGQLVAEGDALSVNGEEWELLPTPGHADDHLSLYNRKKGVLLGGDNILRNITTWLGPPRSDLAVYLRSLEAIMALPNLSLILPAHGSPISDPVKRIREIIAWRMKRTDDVLGVVARAGARGATLREIFRELYGGDARTSFFMARGWIEVTLGYLLERGSITRISGSRSLSPFSPGTWRCPPS